MANTILPSLIVVLVLSLPLSVNATEPITLPTIELPGPIHFTLVDGNDVVIAPGTYQTAHGKESTLTLTRESDQPAIEIQAGSTSYGGVLDAPTALLIAEDGEDDEIHLVLLSPDGNDLDAIGSLSGTRSRATRFLGKQQTNYAYAMARYPKPPSSSPGSSMIRVPPASASAILQPPPTQANQDQEDTGFVPAPVEAVTPVTWGYLRMNAPDQVVGLLKKVQTGALKATSLEGLAGPAQIQSLLAKSYPDLPSTMMQQGVAPRGLGLVGPSSSASTSLMIQPSPNTSQAPAGGIVTPPSQASPNLLQPLPSSPSQPPVSTAPVPGVGAGPPSQASQTTALTKWTDLITAPFDPGSIGIKPGIDIPVRADVSPNQVDFGSIWDGQAPRVEIRVAVPRDGGLTVSLTQNRPFRIVKVSTATGLLKLIRSTPSGAVTVEQEPTSSSIQPPWNFRARAGQDLWIVLEFAPRADLFAGDSAGRYTTTVKVDGYKWMAEIPVAGYFNGAKVGIIPMFDTYDLHVINPFQMNPNNCAVPIPQILKLLNASQTPSTVVVEPAGFPGQFSMPALTVVVPPGGSQQVALPITLHCLSDMWSRQFDLPVKIRYAGQERQTSFRLNVYPYMYRIPTHGTLGSCKYSAEFWTYPDGNFHLTVTASTSAVWQREFDYAFYFRGMKVAALQLYLDGVAQLGTGVQKSYGFRSSGLEANYMQLFAEKPDIRLRCVSR